MFKRIRNTIKAIFNSLKNDTNVTNIEETDIDAPKPSKPKRPKAPDIKENLPNTSQFKQNVDIGTQVAPTDVDFSSVYKITSEEIITAYISDLSKYLIGEKNQRIIDNVNDVIDWVYECVNKYGTDSTATMIQEAIGAGLLLKYETLYDYAKAFKYVSDMERYLPNIPISDEVVDNEWITDANIEWDEL